MSKESPTAPLICLHRIEKAGDKAVQEVFFLISLLSPQAVSLNYFFFPADNESRILPHVFKSVQNMKSLLAWVSEIF